MSYSIPYQSMECLHTIEDPGIFNRVAISPDGKKFVSSSYFPVRIWDTATAQLLHELCPDELARSLAISADNQLLAAGCNEVNVSLWNLQTGEKLHRFYICKEFPSEVTCVRFTPDCKTLVSGWGGQINLWDLEKYKRSSEVIGGGSYDFTLSQDGQIMVSTYLSTVYVFNFNTGRLIHELKKPLKFISCIDISPDTKTFAVGNQDGYIKVFSTETAEELISFDTDTVYISSLIFTPDNQTLISCGLENTSIDFWNFRTGEKIHTLEGHPMGLSSIALSADGRTLVSCNDRPSLTTDMVSTMKVWGIR